ncbi:MAG: A/G-specific adenine glycosylase [Ferruginibacter sp.]
MSKDSNKEFFTRSLMHWHNHANKREMPWKGEKNPYKIWLSEIILQQTRVEQGWEYYLRFIKKYPTVKELAAAPEDDVFKLWEGLGYYSRCKNLHFTARYIAGELQGKFPAQYDEIVALKGVGPYTASAIASFAFNLPHAVVDGNVNRVLARYFGIEKAIDSTDGKKDFAKLAQQLLDTKKPGLYNQAIMDFGATVCKPQLPLCGQCVLQARCIAYKEAKVHELPVKEKKIVKKNRWFYFLVIEKEGYVFVRKREAKDIWQNLYEFVLLEWPQQTGAAELLQTEEGQAVLPSAVKQLAVSKEYKQQLTHQTVHACFLHLQLTSRKEPQGYEKLSLQKIKAIAFPKLINDYLTDMGWK